MSYLGTLGHTFEGSAFNSAHRPLILENNPTGIYPNSGKSHYGSSLPSPLFKIDFQVQP
jgi:hypothetical protein